MRVLAKIVVIPIMNPISWFMIYIQCKNKHTLNHTHIPHTHIHTHTHINTHTLYTKYTEIVYL